MMGATTAFMAAPCVAEAGIIWLSGPAGSLCEVIEPTSLDTLTIRAAGARRSSGSMALVTATTPKTLIS